MFTYTDPASGEVCEFDSPLAAYLTWVLAVSPEVEYTDDTGNLGLFAVVGPYILRQEYYFANQWRDRDRIVVSVYEFGSESEAAKAYDDLCIACDDVANGYRPTKPLEWLFPF